MNSVIFILSLSGFVYGSILNDEFNDSNLDGEVAMKNLEAAQVEERYTRRKRSAEDNPLLQIPRESKG